MDPYVYESYTVPTSYVVSTPVTKMDYSHITFVAYLFSTIFSTSTTTPQMSTVAQTIIQPLLHLGLGQSGTTNMIIGET